MSNPQIHASVLNFLIDHGYMESVEAFKREARQHLDSASGDDQLAYDLSQLHLERSNELLEGDNDYFNQLNADYPLIHDTNILAVAFEPHTRVLATSSVDKSVKISTMLASQDLYPKTYRHHQAPVLSIAFHPTCSGLMMTTSMDGTVALVNTDHEPEFGADTEKEGLHQHFKDHQKYVVQGLFSLEDGHYMATASYDRTVCLYQSDRSTLPNYTMIKRLGPFIGNVETICFMKNQLVVGVRDDNYLHYTHLDSLASYRVNMNATGDDWVSFSPVCLSANHGLLLCTTDHASGRTILFKAGSDKQVQNYYIFPNDNTFITRKHVWHPSGRYFYAIGSNEHDIAVVEVKTGQIVNTLKGHQGMVRCLDAYHQGLFSAGYDHTVKQWSKQETVAR
ncbi:WD40-repeat-containing domain protein [Gilbertella persicaria]|uniref:WD40-repeat-containing domain protein n=1 Tax=Gilbertella persicaria TaxID=101096 RepID=UPI00221FB3F9|nr:WD40-repeat-containing domain protein [Gilbertella persicaria]KAI8063432.1 WD40-repeat-containing domain protein [Gilbertella persicaria]